MRPQTPPDRCASTSWTDFGAIRAETERRAAFLSAEDQTMQAMADASPTKWHRAHTTWFFERFIMQDRAGYRPFDAAYDYLFNSYYDSVGPRHLRAERGLISRPRLEDIQAYRAHVDRAIADLLSQADNDTQRLVTLGLHHEQQHQELIWTDILAALALTGHNSAYDPDWREAPPTPTIGHMTLEGGRYRIGYGESDFCFDNERPAHHVWIEPIRLARRLVTNGEWLSFMEEGGYATPTLWLSDGWACARAKHWHAPEYWIQLDGAWHAYGLNGLKPVDPAAPVCHVSYYEADAFARWAGRVLPSEAEWEAAVGQGGLGDAFGLRWQWTRSAYGAYPGYRPEPGALGEYNGKFMINQMVLRGSSAATPKGAARATYRNFFYPHQRWQFTGLRLAQHIA